MPVYFDQASGKDEIASSAAILKAAAAATCHGSSPARDLEGRLLALARRQEPAPAPKRTGRACSLSSPRARRAEPAPGCRERGLAIGADDRGSAGRGSTTRCCIAGGGPAGMMLGFLLARAGVRRRGAREARRLPARLPRRHGPPVDACASWTSSACSTTSCSGRTSSFAGRRRLLRRASRSSSATSAACPTRYAFIAHDAAVGVPRFPRRRGAEAARVRAADAGRTSTALIEGDGRVVGVRGSDARRRASRSAPICTVGCDGRHSTVRAAAGSPSRTSARRSTCCGFACRATRRRRHGLARVAPGHFLVTSTAATTGSARSSSPRAAPKTLQRAADRGVPRAGRREAAPLLAPPHRRRRDVGRRQAAHRRRRPAARWSKPGLLCIGDAAHAMSPVGGVGINLAIQDAVAAANLLAAKLRAGTLTATTSTPCAAPALADQGDAGGAGRDPEQRAGAGDRQRRRRAECRCRCAC